MPKVDLTATKDFTYMTRRLTAGDPFQARNPLEARILTRVRKVAEEPKAKAAPKTIAAADVVDHGLDNQLEIIPAKPATEIKPGKPGGSKPGKQARKRKAAAKK